MKTIIEKVDSNNLDNYETTFKLASEIIKNGGLVAFPTETVYGLGANAFDKNALEKIYIAKGRPRDNPLIVHINKTSDLESLILGKSKIADLLIEKFWPGPLTLIFKKNENLPIELTGGLNTIAVRFPKDLIAQKLIEVSGTQIAAPSANSSGKPSPTKASHVEFDLSGKIDMIIDGGSSEYGLESTIIDVSSDTPCILRPGSITKEDIEKVIGDTIIDKSILEKTTNEFSPIAPGMKYKHYSPIAKVIIVNGELDNVIKRINEMAEDAILKYKDSKKIGILATEQSVNKYDEKKFFVLVVGNRDKEETIASNLFKVLRKFDFNEVDLVFAEGFVESKVGLAIMNRLKKAAGNNIISV